MTKTRSKKGLLMDHELAELLDIEIKEPLKIMLSMTPPTNFDDIPAARIASKKLMAERKGEIPDVPGIVTEDRIIPCPDAAPDMMVRLYRPENKAGVLPALLWIHGGGYIFGDVESTDYAAKKLAQHGDCLVVSPEYRLAPEDPYPAPLEDCYTALKWLSDNTAGLNVDPSRIAIGGGSAGGGLAAGLALLVRDRAEINIMFQLLIYPMINDANTMPPGEFVRDALFWTREHNLVGWRSYLGKEPGGDNVQYYAAPYRASDLSDLPPAYICTGDIDLFAEEDIEYARRLVAAGVPTELHVYPGGCHAFDGLVPQADISRRFTGDIHRAIKRAFHGIS